MARRAVDALSYDEEMRKKLAYKSRKDKEQADGSARPQWSDRQGYDSGDEDEEQEYNTPAVSEGELAAVADAGNVAVQKAVNLLESWANLKALQEKSAIAHKTYDKKLKKLQEQFKKDMAKIDDKSVVLRKSLMKINTAQSPELLKEGLLSLSDGDKELFSEKDWDDFLNGNKTIEL